MGDTTSAGAGRAAAAIADAMRAAGLNRIETKVLDTLVPPAMCVIGS